jgi:hypothetical protein
MKDCEIGNACSFGENGKGTSANHSRCQPITAGMEDSFAFGVHRGRASPMNGLIFSQASLLACIVALWAGL